MCIYIYIYIYIYIGQNFQLGSVQRLEEEAYILYHHHHHHVQEGLGLIPVSCILKMKLVPPSLPQSSYASSSFWFIL